MPKPPQPKPAEGALSPWAYALRDYMWNRRPATEPPRTAGQIATHLGQRRQTVYSWLEGTTPDAHTLFAVMMQLGIPLERLAEGYAQAGMPFPPLTDADAAATQERMASAPAPRARATRATRPTSPDLSDPWEATITATTDSLRQLGIPEAAIAATVANIRANKAGQPHAQIRHVTAEHTETEQESEREGGGEGEGESKRQPRRPQARRR